MSDLISRQAAIDALDEQIRQCDKALSAFDISMKDEYAVKVERASLVAFRETLEYMPSAQPECEDAVSRFEVLRLIDYSSNDLNDSVDNRYFQGKVKELPPVTPKQPGWIPCDVRTPKHVEESYWICTDTGYQCQCRWTNNVFGLGARDEWGWKLLDIPQYSKVVAWQPLPTPYREGGQE